MLVNFFGKRGAGKTTTIKGQLIYAKRPCVVMDLLGNFHDIEACHVETTSDAILAMEDFLKNGNPLKATIVLKTSDPSTSVDFISAALWDSGNGTLVLDEVDAFDSGKARCLDNLFRYGRNKGIDMVTGCRRPFEIPRTITAGANALYIFQTNEPRDLDYYSELIGPKAYELARVPKYSGFFIDYDQDGLLGKFYIDREGQIFHAGNIGM